jgi:hypothetical protein
MYLVPASPIQWSRFHVDSWNCMNKEFYSYTILNIYTTSWKQTHLSDQSDFFQIYS